MKPVQTKHLRIVVRIGGSGPLALETQAAKYVQGLIEAGRAKTRAHAQEGAAANPSPFAHLVDVPLSPDITEKRYSAGDLLRKIEGRLDRLADNAPDDAFALSILIREYGAMRALAGPVRPRYGQFDVLSPDDARDALSIDSDTLWARVKDRIPFSLALGRRTLRIQYGRLIEWLNEQDRRPSGS